MKGRRAEPRSRNSRCATITEGSPRPDRSFARGDGAPRTASGDDFDERPHLLARDGHRVALTGVFDALGHDFVLVLPLDVGAAVASDDVEHSASSQARLERPARPFEFLPRLEVVMNLPDHDGALADRRRHALERPRPHVADGEDAGDGGLEVLGRTDQRPVVQQFIVAQVRPCDDKPVGIDLDVPWKPARAGTGANEHEEGVCLDDVRSSPRPRPPA